MWLLAEETARALQQAERGALTATAQQRADFMMRADASAANGMPRNLRIASDVAEIRVEGALTPRPDFILCLMGIANTTYQDIRTSLAMAQAEPSVKSAVLVVDSPGGTVAGLFDTIAAIQSFSKPMRVKASNAQSAAYGIAAVAGKIDATNLAATFGSIGTAIDFAFWADEELVSVTNTDSPDKRPDPRTPEGRAVIVKHLDDLSGLFVDSIASGRGASSSTVVNNFGRGATLLASEALKRGMIDSIAGMPAQRATATQRPSTSAQHSASQKESHLMDVKTLKLQYPEACDELLREGEAREKDRVTAHLTMGEKSGDLKTAMKAIRDGSLMTQALMAEYMSAGLNRRDRSLRQADSDAAGLVIDGASAPENGGAQDLGDAIVALMDKQLGKAG